MSHEMIYRSLLVVLQAAIAFCVGCRGPLRRGRPRMPGARSDVGSYEAASSRKRVKMHSLRRAASSNSNAAKLLSATTTIGRSGTQRLTINNICRGAVGKPVGTSSTLQVMSLGRRQHRAKWQRPAALRPGNRCYQRQAQPAQAAGLDEMSVARAYGIAINSFSGNLGAAPPFDRIFQCHQQRFFRHKRLDQ